MGINGISYGNLNEFNVGKRINGDERQLIGIHQWD
jgi:hypothetical protein